MILDHIMVGGILVQMHINAKIQNRYAEPGLLNEKRGESSRQHQLEDIVFVVLILVLVHVGFLSISSAFMLRFQ